jgi:outer membrane protein assembly factor BamB
VSRHAQLLAVPLLSGFRVSTSASVAANPAAYGALLLDDQFLPAFLSVFAHKGPFANPTSSIYALDATTGAVRWSVYDGMNGYSAPAVADGVIYLSALLRAVTALDASTGAVRWHVATNVAGDAVPAVANGVVYVGFADGAVDALDAGTGARRWRFQTDRAWGLLLSPVVANGAVYVSSGASLYALSA